MTEDFPIPKTELKSFLDEKLELYGGPDFIKTDPVSLPHAFSTKEDREIIGFLAATIAWGQRTTILKNMQKLVALLDEAPYEFVMEADKSDLKRFAHFVHRTFNGDDCQYFIRALMYIYRDQGGLGALFQDAWQQSKSIQHTIARVRELFFALPHPERSQKHFANVLKGSAGKRINMFLRWMVRQDSRGVDFGLWTQIPASALMLPLDVHSGRVARSLGLLQRKQDDWKAVEEVTAALRLFDPEDPVKYDYALFGLGVFEKF